MIKMKMHEASAVEADYLDSSVCLHQLFERQVKRTPKAVAVMFEGEN